MMAAEDLFNVGFLRPLFPPVSSVGTGSYKKSDYFGANFVADEGRYVASIDDECFFIRIFIE